MFFSIPVILFAAVAAAQTTDPATLEASIKFAKNYSLLPACINQCVWDIGDNDTPDIGGDVAIHLSCAAPWINGCYCRPQSATVAHAFISSCATYLCSTPQPSDIDAGTSVYASYCSQALGAAYTPAGIQQAPATSTASTPQTDTRATSPIARQTPPSATIVAGPPSSPEPTALQGKSSSDNIAGLSKGAFIGVVVSASCSVLGLVFGVAFKVHRHRVQMKVARQQQSGVVFEQK